MEQLKQRKMTSRAIQKEARGGGDKSGLHVLCIGWIYTCNLKVHCSSGEEILIWRERPFGLLNILCLKKLNKQTNIHDFHTCLTCHLYLVDPAPFVAQNNVSGEVWDMLNIEIPNLSFFLQIYIYQTLLSKAVTEIHTYIHTLMAVAAMQGAGQHIRSSVGFRNWPRTLRHADQGNRTSDLPNTRRWLYPWSTATLHSAQTKKGL